MRRVALLLLAALPSAALAQPLVFWDAFAGTGPLSAHVPDADPSGVGWSTDGTGDEPSLSGGRLAWSSKTWAVGPRPTGPHTLSFHLLAPTSTPSTNLGFDVAARWTSETDNTRIRLVWHADGSLRVRLVQTDPAGTTSAQVGSFPAPLDRLVPVAVEASGDTLRVSVDGQGPVLATASGVTASAATARFALAPQSSPSLHPWAVDDLRINVPDTAPTQVCPGLVGLAARQCARAAHAPLAVLGYDAARDALFAAVWPDASGAIDDLYGGAATTPDPALPTSPRQQAQADGFNTEHVWPQSRGAGVEPFRSDLHHLAPTLDAHNTQRSNRPYGDDFDEEGDTQAWLLDRAVYAPYPGSVPPVSDTPLFSRVETDLDADGDGFLSLAASGARRELGRFDVRHARRGDAARMAAYALLVYQVEAEDGAEGRAFIGATRDVLLRWHIQDPADDDERDRSARIAALQGNHNPFVLDPTLLRRAFYEGDPTGEPAAPVWINEIHHTNAGHDTGEGVELAGPAGTDLYGWRVWTLSGHGHPYTADPAGPDGPSIPFSGTIDDEGGGLGAVWQGAARLRGGCQGYALTDPNGTLVQFLSTGGCRFNALSGPPADAALASGDPSLAWSTALQGPRPPSGGPPRPVQQWSTLPAGHSLQLSGAGRTRDDFRWTGPLPASPGRLNDYQAPASERNAATGWAAGDPVPPGLLAPAPDRPPPPTLTLGPVLPNPVRHRARLAVSLPPEATGSATVYDATGRIVWSLPSIAGRVDLDASTLASGVYVVRLSATFPDGSRATASRPFSVVR